MITFTFDTNCLIDVDEGRASAASIRAIVKAHRSQKIHAAFVAVSASERQPDDLYLPTYRDFAERLEKLGFADIPHVMGIAYFDISYWNHAVWADESSLLREKLIHNVLFPNISFDSPASDPSNNVGLTDPKRLKWRNAWCDRQMVWAHDHSARDIFVTSDRNFSKLVGHPEFAAFRVCTPDQAISAIP